MVISIRASRARRCTLPINFSSRVLVATLPWYFIMPLPTSEASIYRGADFVVSGACAHLMYSRKKGYFYVGLSLHIKRTDLTSEAMCPTYDYLLGKNVNMPS